MRAATYRRYGPPEVVRIEQVPMPRPAADEVLIRVRACTVSSADWRVRSLEVPPGFGPLARPAFGIFAPRKPVLGCELAGEVEAIGKAVKRFAVGERVFAYPGFAMGSHAEYRTMRESGNVVHMPSGMSFEEAAALSFGGTTALYYLRDLAELRPGQRVLVLGAAGAVGSAAVQLAKHLGAIVTGVTSGPNLSRVRELGADRTIDYKAEPVLTSGQRYDVIFETVGKYPLADCRHALNPGGCVLLCVADLGQLVIAGFSSLFGKRVVRAGAAPERVEDLLELARLAEAGRYRPLLDRSFAFDDIVAAHHYVDSGRKRGSVVLTMPS